MYLMSGKVAIEALKCATQLDGLKAVIIEACTATQDVHMFGKTQDSHETCILGEKPELLRSEKMGRREIEES